MKKTLLLVVTILIIGIISLAFILTLGRDLIGKNQPPQKLPSEEEQKSARQKDQENLLELVQEIFAEQSPGTTFSIAVYDLNNDEYFGFNDEKAEHAASLSKVLTATYVFDQTEKGKAKLSDSMGAYNIETQIQFLINQSSEDSWQLLDEKFKPVEQNKYAKSIGLNATDLRIGKNLMSPKDVAVLLKKLAKGELLSEANRAKLFSYMQKTESEDLFSPALELEGATFYHKTGKYLGEGHDAAIVEHPSHPFVIVLFTTNNVDTNLIGRGTVMQATAEAVYEYFDKM